MSRCFICVDSPQWVDGPQWVDTQLKSFWIVHNWTKAKVSGSSSDLVCLIPVFVLLPPEPSTEDDDRLDPEYIESFDEEETNTTVWAHYLAVGCSLWIKKKIKFLEIKKMQN